MKAPILSTNPFRNKIVLAPFEGRDAMGQLELRVMVAEALLRSSKQVVLSAMSTEAQTAQKIKITQAKYAVSEKVANTKNVKDQFSKKDVETQKANQAIKEVNQAIKEARVMEAKAKQQANKVSNSLRTDRVDHMVVNMNKRGRCRYCKSQTVFACNKCNVPVHPKCFDSSHAAN